MFSRFSTPKTWGVLTKTFPKPSFTHFFHKNGPRGGGLPDFTRRGTNYLHTPLLKTSPGSKLLVSDGMLLRFSAPKIGGVRMKTFSKPSFTHFFQKWPPGGGLPDFTRRGTNYLHTPLLKRSSQSTSLDSDGIFLGFSAPKKGGVHKKNIFKTLIYPFFPKNGPRGGGGLPDFARRGTNHLHTPLLKKYPKRKSLDSNGIFFEFRAPKIGGVLMKTVSKPSFTHFFQKKWPPGEGVYQISPDVALTTCIILRLHGYKLFFGCNASLKAI